MDCEALRKTQHLENKSLHLEQHSFYEESVVAAFAETMTRFCDLQKCDYVTLTKAYPKYLTRRLRSALKL